MGDKTRGLYDKFIIRRTDGRDGPGQKHEGCQYFVLDLTHDPHALPAILAYARSCADDYPRLAEDLRKIIGDEERLLLQSGYVGVDSQGRVVDRRQHPEATPVQENRFFKIPVPRKVEVPVEPA